ncbi:MAG: GxxExxY protein, partial [Nitrospinae bacterium]|nr:GxxExxY protein [Nitrospinota bacterium]
MLKHKDLTEKIIKGFYEVYNELGPGFLESIYENSLYIILNEYDLNIERQKQISVYFKENIVGSFKPDLIVEAKVILEVKAVRALNPAHESQIINYLKATEIEVG